MTVSLTVNAVPRILDVDADRTLLDVLRNDLDLRASHFGCGVGECGACMVLIDDRAVPSCDTPLWSVEGRQVRTAEGLGTRAAPHAVQRAFIEEQAAQCGYCTSGMLISAAALLTRNPAPDDAAIREGMARNLCRCGTHPRVMRAIARAVAPSQP
ncbi:MAG: (2Fe-2S)-binding protein [Variovorax sp.]|nr:MAG: (2Fe-2S)-binding protein [Variovorax sp.]